MDIEPLSGPRMSMGRPLCPPGERHLSTLREVSPCPVPLSDFVSHRQVPLGSRHQTLIEALPPGDRRCWVDHPSSVLETCAFPHAGPFNRVRVRESSWPSRPVSIGLGGGAEIRESRQGPSPMFGSERGCPIHGSRFQAFESKRLLRPTLLSEAATDVDELLRRTPPWRLELDFGLTPSPPYLPRKRSRSKARFLLSMK